jgi:UDP-N-acetylmuramoyl-L-alanyl-D-glutamate--2,6-diaminopimelate ligase
LVDQTKLHINSQLLGSVNAYNLLITAQVMRWAGLAPSRIGERLAALTPPPGRMETIGGEPRAHTPQVVVDYAHSPDALKHALLMAREICGGQLWVVFGCGGQRDVSKRAPMGRIAESLADRVVITDDNPRHESSLTIIRAIQSGMRQPERSRVLADRREAIEWTIAQAGGEDVVLIAGKGHETEQIIGDRREPLDDRSIAQHALNAGLNDHKEAC